MIKKFKMIRLSVLGRNFFAVITISLGGAPTCYFLSISTRQRLERPMAFNYSFCLGKNSREADILSQGRFAESVRKVNSGHWLSYSSGLSDKTIFVMPVSCFPQRRDTWYSTSDYGLRCKQKGIEKSHQKRLPAL